MLAFITTLILSALSGVILLTSTNYITVDNYSYTHNSSVLTQSAASGTAMSFDADEANNEAIAQSMYVYGKAVNDYLTAHPAASGAIADTSLTFPSWYSNPGWSNYISSGYAYVYTNSITAIGSSSITAALARISNASLMAGENRSGSFYSPGTGVNASITLPSPASIPSGSPVLIFTVY